MSEVFVAGALANHGTHDDAHDIFRGCAGRKLDSAAEAKISDAHVQIGGGVGVAVDEDVGRLEVAMENAAAVQVSNRGADLARNVTYVFDVERPNLFPEKRMQIHAAVFEHHVSVAGASAFVVV